MHGSMGGGGGGVGKRVKEYGLPPPPQGKSKFI